MFNIKHIKYTYIHKKAFLKVEKELTGSNSIRGLLHDVDKLILYPVLPKKIVSKMHRRFSRHHINSARTRNDFIEMMIDWESARFTKPDKPLDAQQTLFVLYPQLINVMIPLLIEFNLYKPLQNNDIMV